MIKMIIDEDGDEIWYDSSVREYEGDCYSSNLHWHRLDGPACIYNNGIYGWYINDVRYYNFNEFQKAGRLSDEQMCILRLKYGEI